jgi:hypothetical protein
VRVKVDELLQKVGTECNPDDDDAAPLSTAFDDLKGTCPEVQGAMSWSLIRVQ